MAGRSFAEIDTEAALELAEELTFAHIDDKPALLVGVGDIETLSVRIDREGLAHTRLRHTIDGVPVFGSQAIVHLRADGSLFRVTDEITRNIAVTTTFSLHAEDALSRAVEHHGGWDHVSDDPEVDLWIFAHTGEVIFTYNNLQTFQLQDGDKKTWDMHEGRSYNNATVGASTDGDLLETHDVSQHTLDFLQERFARDSYDGAGAVINSYGHYGDSYVNAFWNGSSFSYGDGDGYYSSYLGVLDVTAHEIGHAVTQYEAGLIYHGEPGALNEATSDIFAAAVEAYVDGSVTPNTWKVGEDCWVEPGETALRYMDAPSTDGSSRDHYSNRYQGSSDNGGVHWNSGIANHFFYLLSEGGAHHDPNHRNPGVVNGVASTLPWTSGMRRSTTT